MELFSTLFILLIFENLSAQAEPLRAADVEEGPCIKPYPKAMSPGLVFTLQQFQNAKTPYYVPMGSKHLYRSYATYLLGRSPQSQDELDLMNLRIRGSSSHTWRTSGYSQSFYQQCVPYGHLFRAYCVAGFGSPATDLKTILQTTDTLVYTDNESTFMFVRCVMGIWNDWKVLSTKPELAEKTKQEILKRIAELGFDISMVEYAKYYENVQNPK